MTAGTVDSAAANRRISRVAKALMATRELNVKQLAAATGIDEDTLGRRLRCEGKNGWLAGEVLALSVALDVEVGLFYDSDPADWFRSDAPTGESRTVTPVVQRGPTRRDTSGYGLEFLPSGNLVSSTAAA